LLLAYPLDSPTMALTSTLERRRVLLAAEASARGPTAAALATLGPGWEAVEADGFEKARFRLQMERCDVLLLDASLHRPGDSGGVAGLSAARPEPVVFLADDRAAVTLDAVRRGADYWMPRALACSCPPLLGALLHQALELAELRRRLGAAEADVRAGRQHVERLLGLLWDAAPTDGRGPWFTQRHMMERLQEELARSRRRGGPLSVALGEVTGAGADASGLSGWAAQQILRAKRRCDVAGQYGPNGFMLLLPRSTDREAVGCCRRLQLVLEGGPPAHAVYFGVASFSPAAATAQTLLRRAEERLERAKRDVPGRVAF
jgi:GGDEF domain-containing protein